MPFKTLKQQRFRGQRNPQNAIEKHASQIAAIQNGNVTADDLFEFAPQDTDVSSNKWFGTGDPRDPVNTSATGLFIAPAGLTVGSTDYVLGQFEAGVLQWGATTTGWQEAGLGALALDENGLSIKRAATVTDLNSIKFIDPSTGDILSIITPSGTTNNSLGIILQQLAGGGSTLVLETNAPTTKSSNIFIRAISNTLEARIYIISNDIGTSEIILNQAGHNVDVKMLDDNGDTFFNFDASAKTLSLAGGDAIDIDETLAPTPAIIGTSTAGAGTYTTQAGDGYVRGKMVWIDFELVWTAHTGTGNMRISGLPYTSANNGINTPLSVDWSNITLAAAGNKLMAVVVPNTTQIQIREIGSGAASSVAIDAAGTLRVSGWYRRA